MTPPLQRKKLIFGGDKWLGQDCPACHCTVEPPYPNRVWFHREISPRAAVTDDYPWGLPLPFCAPPSLHPHTPSAPLLLKVAWIAVVSFLILALGPPLPVLQVHSSNPTLCLALTLMIHLFISSCSVSTSGYWCGLLRNINSRLSVSMKPGTNKSMGGKRVVIQYLTYTAENVTWAWL